MQFARLRFVAAQDVHDMEMPDFVEMSSDVLDEVSFRDLLAVDIEIEIDW